MATPAAPVGVAHAAGGGPGAPRPRGRPRQRSLRSALGWLVAAVLFPLVVAGVAFLAYEWTQQRQAALARLRDEARTLRRAVERELAVDDALLNALATSRDIDASDWRSFHRAAQQAAARARPGSWVVLYDRTGQTLVNTSVPFGAPLPNFRKLASVASEVEWNGRKLPLPGAWLFTPFETRLPSFSGIFYGPVSRRPVVASTTPVLRGGEPQYVVAVAYSSEYLADVLQKERPAGAGVSAIFDIHGRFIARSRDSERFVGRPGPAPFTEGTGRLAREGVGESVNVESVAVFYAYSRSAERDVFVGVAVPRAVILAPARHALWSWLAILSVAALIGTLLAVRIWRRVGEPLAALAEQARAGHGVRPAAGPSGIEEVEALRVALDEAATHERVRREAEREREKARAELRDSERRFRAIFEDAAVGIVEVDDEDRIVAANGTLAAMLGYASDELVGMTIHELTAPEDAEVTRELIGRGHAGELRTFAYEKRYLRRDGARIWVHVHVAVVRDEEGRYLRAVGTASDITERRRAQDALREADQRKDEFLGMLSHELRNPLAPIRSSVHLLHRVDPTSVQAARARAVIDRQSAHLARIVDDLLDVTRIARGKILLHRGRLELREVVRRAVEDAHLPVEDRGVRLRLELPPRPLWADADGTRITQIIGNLLANARKFTRGGDEIVVALREVDGAAELTVRDTGAGIDPPLLTHLFDAFVQGERTLARSEGGLGLGLALVKGLVELHGGSVTAHSDGVGKGAAFVVALPLAGPGGDAERSLPAPGPARAARQVLVVDDNADAAESLAELVGLFGHRAEVAFDGPSAIEKVRRHRPDVVLCDIGLPGMTGYDVARVLRAELDGRVRLVAVSGYAQPDDLKRAQDAGFDAHVAKPADPERIAELLA